MDEEFIRHRTTEVSLRDGIRVRIRPIVPDDKAHLIDGFTRMSPESRYRRFLSPIAELTPDMLRELTELDYVSHFAYIAFAVEGSVEVGAGVARYVRAPEEPEVAEAAVTVVDEYQGRGLGTFLLQALGAVALENGIRRFRGYALETNRPIRDVLEALGADIHHDSPGLIRVEIDLPARLVALRDSPLYDILRAVARGDGPVFVPAGGLPPNPPGGA
ncbi:MAG: GNAT family N-acetyltransferase [Actinomycetota bacterium]